MRAGFVTFEGIDGSGKTTVSRRVSEILRERGEDVVWTSEPTRHWLGEAVRKSYRDDVGPLAEAFLFLADRAVHVAEIRSHLEDGMLVVCDRYADSTYAYQGARLEGVVSDPISFLRETTEPWFLPPDLTLLLRVPADVGMARIADRPDLVRFEDPALLEKVAANYDRLAQAKRYVIVDARKPLDDVVTESVRAIEERLGGRPR